MEPFQSVIVVGPPGCGKTTHAAALADHFGLNHIVDGDDQLPKDGKLERTNTLYLVQHRPDDCGIADSRVLDFHAAMNLAGLSARSAHA